MTELSVFPEDWQRALAIVAHPDDMEYGAASVVARWTGQGKQVAYVLVTDGEAGIQSMPPAETGPIRRAEQIAGAPVGVDDVEFLGLPDGLLEEGLALRATLVEPIRRHRPDVILTINFRESWGGPSWNHVDHRAVGRSLLDAVRDAANPWLFTDLGDAWGGVEFVAFGSSPNATHAVDVTDTIDAGVASLECHRAYLDNLDSGGSNADSTAFLREQAAATGPRLGVELAVAFELLSP